MDDILFCFFKHHLDGGVIDSNRQNNISFFICIFNVVKLPSYNIAFKQSTNIIRIRSVPVGIHWPIMEVGMIIGILGNEGDGYK
jgi:hypothetical protein